MAGVLTVGRPKKRKSNEPQKTLVTIKGNQEWLDWLQAFASELGMPVTMLIDLALREKAERHKRESPPSRIG